MPEGRFAQLVLVVEDNVTGQFFRRWLLEHVRVYPRDIRTVLPKRVSGSGEQFVRDQFAVEVPAHRTIRAKRSNLLVVVQDADQGDWAEHYKALADAASDRAGIYIFVPKRHIETWVHQLNGNQADEIEKHRFRYRGDRAAIVKAADVFLEAVRSEKEADFVPSLNEGIREARQIPRSHQH
jgi:hypothetical protein